MPAYIDPVKHGPHHVALYRVPGFLNGYLEVLLPAGEPLEASLTAMAAARDRSEQQAAVALKAWWKNERSPERRAAAERDFEQAVREEQARIIRETRERLREKDKLLEDQRRRINDLERLVDRQHRELRELKGLPPIGGGSGLTFAIWTGNHPARVTRSHLPSTPVTAIDGFTFVDLLDGEAFESRHWYAVYAPPSPGGTVLTSALMGVDGTGAYYDLSGAADVSLMSVEQGRLTLTY